LILLPFPDLFLQLPRSPDEEQAMNPDRQPCERRSGLKIVCEQCGNLSIKAIDPVNATDLAEIYCGRCNAVRGTLADLREMARRSTDIFEI
jgi:hypothetical protein